MDKPASLTKDILSSGRWGFFYGGNMGIVTTWAGQIFEKIGQALAVVDKGFLNQIRQSNVPGHTYVKIRGHNHDLGTADEEISALGTLVWGNWPAAAAGVVLISDDVNDDGDPVSTGARTVTIRGLKDVGGVWSAATATVTMNGTTATAATAQEFIRINEIEVATAGSSLSNEGTITASISGSNIMSIYPKHSTSDAGRFTVASGGSLSLHNPEGSAASGKEVTYHIFCRDNTVTDSPFLLRASWHSKDGGFRPNGSIEIFTEKVDMIFIAHASLAGANCSASVEGYTKEN